MVIKGQQTPGEPSRRSLFSNPSATGPRAGGGSSWLSGYPRAEIKVWRSGIKSWSRHGLYTALAGWPTVVTATPWRVAARGRSLRNRPAGGLTVVSVQLPTALLPFASSIRQEQPSPVAILICQYPPCLFFQHQTRTAITCSYLSLPVPTLPFASSTVDSIVTLYCCCILSLPVPSFPFAPSTGNSIVTLYCCCVLSLPIPSLPFAPGTGNSILSTVAVYCLCQYPARLLLPVSETV